MDLNIAFYKSPIGILKIYSSEYEIKKIELVREINDFECSDFNYNVLEQLDKYFKGNLQTFNIPYNLPGESEFQKKVYEELSKVKYGKTLSYKELAQKAGKPKAFRAVGSIMAKNPIPIILPCHRITKTDGTSGDYNLGGKAAKSFLLHLEKEHA